MAIRDLKQVLSCVRICNKYDSGVEMSFGLVDVIETLVDNDMTF